MLHRFPSARGAPGGSCALPQTGRRGAAGGAFMRAPIDARSHGCKMVFAPGDQLLRNAGAAAWSLCQALWSVPYNKIVANRGREVVLALKLFRDIPGSAGRGESSFCIAFRRGLRRHLPVSDGASTVSDAVVSALPGYGSFASHCYFCCRSLPFLVTGSKQLSGGGNNGPTL
jgi:hypothetical protein